METIIMLRPHQCISDGYIINTDGEIIVMFYEEIVMRE